MIEWRKLGTDLRTAQFHVHVRIVTVTGVRSVAVTLITLSHLGAQGCGRL